MPCSKWLEFRFIGPKDMLPVFHCPIFMLLCPFQPFFYLFTGLSRGFLTATLPHKLADLWRRLIVLSEMSSLWLALNCAWISGAANLLFLLLRSTMDWSSALGVHLVLPLLFLSLFAPVFFKLWIVYMTADRGIFSLFAISRTLYPSPQSVLIADRFSVITWILCPFPAGIYKKKKK